MPSVLPRPTVLAPAPTRVCARCRQTKVVAEFTKHDRILKTCCHCRRLGAARIGRFRLRHQLPDQPGIALNYIDGGRTNGGPPCP